MGTKTDSEAWALAENLSKQLLQKMVIPLLPHSGFTPTTLSHGKKERRNYGNGVARVASVWQEYCCQRPAKMMSQCCQSRDTALLQQQQQQQQQQAWQSVSEAAIKRHTNRKTKHHDDNDNKDNDNDSDKNDNDNDDNDDNDDNNNKQQ